MTIEPRNSDNMTAEQIAVWRVIYSEFMEKPVPRSKYSHVVAGEIADRVVDVLANNRKR